ncbi:MAG: hypothetical protein ABW006_11250, partial [Hyphomicrobium sp.]
ISLIMFLICASPEGNRINVELFPLFCWRASGALREFLYLFSHGLSVNSAFATNPLLERGLAGE